jgi:hypothetical protein
MMNRNRMILFACLVLTLAAAAWVSKSDDDVPNVVVAPVPAQMNAPRKRSANKSQSHEQPVLVLDRLQRSPMAVYDLNPFEPKSWFVAPPPAPQPPPQQPTAPPLPYVFQGKVEVDSGHWVFYLIKGEQLYTVRKGDVFDGTYRLDGIENGNLVIQYLPLSIKQFLPVASEF